MTINEKDAVITHIALFWDDEAELWQLLSVGKSEHEILERKSHWQGKGVEGIIVYKAELINENKKPNLKAPAKGILAFLNKKTSHNYRAVDANLNPIIARLKSGVTPGQVKQVIAMKVREWGTDERMGAYLRPKTLFARSNFENYLGCLKEQEV